MIETIQDLDAVVLSSSGAPNDRALAASEWQIRVVSSLPRKAGGPVTLTTLEDVLGGTRSPKIELTLRCTRCEKTSKQRFDWVCVHPNREACLADGWDGISLSRVFQCRRCGAIDDYALAGMSYLTLTAGLIAHAAGTHNDRIVFGEGRLWDGTVVRRPSQALARLRELAREQPGSAEAHRRLGNGCERFGILDEAEAAWRRAVDLDENDVEAAYSLADLLLRSPEKAAEGFSFLRRALAALPRAAYPDPEARRNTTRAVFQIVRSLAENGDPLALMATWSSGSVKNQPVVCLSSVDIRNVLDVWDRLVDFAASPEVFGLGLTAELPEDEPTMLESRLIDGASPISDRFLSKAEPVRVAPRVGRNAPCPCGSGKKHKRCCGTQRAQLPAA